MASCETPTTDYRQQRCRHGWTGDQCETCKEIAGKDAEIERLRVALVNAAIPLEAIAMTTTLATLSPEMQDGIHMAITAIRDALGISPT